MLLSALAVLLSTSTLKPILFLSAVMVAVVLLAKSLIKVPLRDKSISFKVVAASIDATLGSETISSDDEGDAVPIPTNPPSGTM